jgi:hypothetical protein
MVVGSGHGHQHRHREPEPAPLPLPLLLVRPGHWPRRKAPGNWQNHTARSTQQVARYRVPGLVWLGARLWIGAWERDLAVRR